MWLAHLLAEVPWVRQWERQWEGLWGLVLWWEEGWAVGTNILGIHREKEIATNEQLQFTVQVENVRRTSGVGLGVGRGVVGPLQIPTCTVSEPPKFPPDGDVLVCPS